MQRMRQIGTIVAVTAVLLFFGVQTGFGKTMIRCQSFYSPTIPLLGSSMPHCAELIDQASGGEFIVKLYEPGKLVPPSEVLESVSKGRVDSGYSAAGFWAGKIPASPLFTSIPFGPEAPEYLAWMLEGNGHKLYQEMYDQAGYNVKVFPVGIVAPETSGWFAEEINSPEQLDGLKMRFFGLGGQVMQKLGVAVTQIPGAEIFPALEKGAIDATEFSMPWLDQKLGFYKLVNYNYFPGWHQQATITELLINKDVWAELSDAEKGLIEVCTRATLTWSLATGEAKQGKVIKENIDEHGVKVRYWSEDMLELFKTTWQEKVLPEQLQDPFFKKVWDDLSAFRENYEYWQRLGFLPRETGLPESMK